VQGDILRLQGKRKKKRERKRERGKKRKNREKERPYKSSTPLPEGLNTMIAPAFSFLGSAALEKK
jgi:hypothetical protein